MYVQPGNCREASLDFRLLNASLECLRCVCFWVYGPLRFFFIVQLYLYTGACPGTQQTKRLMHPIRCIYIYSMAPVEYSENKFSKSWDWPFLILCSNDEWRSFVASINTTPVFSPPGGVFWIILSSGHIRPDFHGRKSCSWHAAVKTRQGTKLQVKCLKPENTTL